MKPPSQQEIVISKVSLIAISVLTTGICLTGLKTSAYNHQYELRTSHAKAETELSECQKDPRKTCNPERSDLQRAKDALSSFNASLVAGLFLSE